VIILARQILSNAFNWQMKICFEAAAAASFFLGWKETCSFFFLFLKGKAALWNCYRCAHIHLSFNALREKHRQKHSNNSCGRFDICCHGEWKHNKLGSGVYILSQPNNLQINLLGYHGQDCNSLSLSVPMLHCELAGSTINYQK
jgi:hypothetical protein